MTRLGLPSLSHGICAWQGEMLNLLRLPTQPQGFAKFFFFGQEAGDPMNADTPVYCEGLAALYLSLAQ